MKENFDFRGVLRQDPEPTFFEILILMRPKNLDPDPDPNPWIHDPRGMLGNTKVLLVEGCKEA